MLGLATSIIKRSPGKKVDKKKLLPAAKGREEQKALPGTAKPSSIIVRPKVSVARKIKVTNYKVASSDEGGVRGGALVYDGLVKRLDSLVKNTNTLSQIVSDQYGNELSKNAADRKQAQKDAQNEKEAEAEAKAEKNQEKKSFGLGMKKLDLFDGIFGTLKRLLFAKAIMELLNFFSDPKKTKPVFDFLEKNMTAIFISTIAALGVAVLAPLIGPGSIMFGTLGLLGNGLITMTAIVAKLSIAILKNPLTWAALIGSAGAWLPKVFPWMVNEKMRATERIIQEDFGGDKAAFLKLLKEATIPEDQRNFSPLSKEGREFFAKRDRLSELYQKYTAFGSDTNILGLRYVNPSVDNALREQIDYLVNGSNQAAPALSTFTFPGMPGYTPGSYLSNPSIPLVSGTNRITRDMFGSRGFGTRDNLGSGRNPGGHTGRDVGLPEGTPLSVVPAGTVIDVGIMGDANDPSAKKDNGGYGNFVVIRLDDGRVIKSAHHSKILVKVGDKVGLQPDGSVKPIGLIGSTGLSTGSHMHLDLGSGYIPASATVTGLVDPDRFILDGGVVTGGRSASQQASGISRSASYEPGAEPPVAVVPQSPAQATPPAASTKMSASILPGGNTAGALNNYYRNQILGAMNRQ